MPKIISQTLDKIIKNAPITVIPIKEEVKESVEESKVQRKKTKTKTKIHDSTQYTQEQMEVLEIVNQRMPLNERQRAIYE